MCRSLLLLFVLAGLSACTVRDLTGPGADPGIERRFVDVRYQVDGSYATCKITHADPRAGLVTAYEVPLPWAKGFKVLVSEETGPFEASITATCLDPRKAGKSFAMLFVDGLEKRRDSAAGPGATAEVSFRVGEED